MILGLMGPAGSGKSTVAKYLHDTWSASRFAFADHLKALAAATFDLSHAQCYGTQAQKEEIDPRYGTSPRWIFQRLGQGARDTFGENFWIEMLLRQIAAVRPRLAVIEDVRYVNEAVAIHAAGGRIWRLECLDRDSTADATHPSETEWKDAPYDAEIAAIRSPGAEFLLRRVRRTIDASPDILRAIRLI